jgi:hypothetical protein
MAKDSTKLIADQAKEIADLKKQLARKQEQESKAMAEVVDYSKQLQEIEEERVNTWKTLAESQELSKLAIQDYSKKASTLSKEERKRELSAIREEKLLQKMLKERTKTLETEKKRVKLQEQYSTAAKKLLETQDKYRDSIEESLGFLDKISNTIEDIPIIGGVLSKALGVDELKEKVTDSLSKTFSEVLNPAAAKTAKSSEEMLESLDGAAEGAEAMQGGFGNALKSLGPMLPIALLLAGAVMSIKAGLDIDQELTDMSRNFGISREEAEGIRHELLNIEATTDVIGANAGALTTAFSELANEMGSIKMISGEMAESQVLLTKQYGLAGEEAAAFQRMAQATGKSAEQNVVAIQGITQELTGGMINYKSVMKDVATTSKAVQATFKGNIGQLTKAVVTARKFGKTLDEVKEITNSLLDIEGSIEKEMQARVLTGKDMNFDIARSLKLRGKETEALEEIYKQAGGYSELMSMAPYQLEATAEAAGMTVDQLIKGAEQQALFTQLSKDTGREIKNAADIREEDIAKISEVNQAEAKRLVLQQQQVSANEKFAQSVDSIKAAFADIAAGPLGDIAALFGTILGNAAVMKGLIVAIGIALIPVAVSMASAAIAAISTMSALTLGIGAIAIVAGIATAAAAMNTERDKAESIQDGMIAPDGGLVVSGEKGTYRLHEDDTVVAGTGLGSISRPTAAPTSTSTAAGSDISELVVLMKELIASVKQPAVVHIGNKVVNEIDRIQSMNRSYVGKVDNSYGAV